MNTPAPTLEQALLARGFSYRAPAPSTLAVLGAQDIVRISDGVVVTTLKAHEAWEWLRGLPLSTQSQWYLRGRWPVSSVSTHGKQDAPHADEMLELIAAGLVVAVTVPGIGSRTPSRIEWRLTAEGRAAKAAAMPAVETDAILDVCLGDELAAVEQ